MDDVNDFNKNKILAEQGNKDAQFHLGNCYEKGIGTTINASEAFKWYKLSAEQGNKNAQFKLGCCYYYGIGINTDNKEAFKWYKLSAEQGDNEAQHYLGFCYCYGIGTFEDENEAFKWYNLSAKQGNKNAQYCLGYCYDNGIGTTINTIEAFKWYKLSAEQGDKNGQLNLGYCYEIGKGTTKDVTEAFKWYKLSAEQGNKNAQFKLGCCYEKGIGTTKDVTEAYKWYKKSKDNEDVESIEENKEIIKEENKELIKQENKEEIVENNGVQSERNTEENKYRIDIQNLIIYLCKKFPSQENTLAKLCLQVVNYRNQIINNKNNKEFIRSIKKGILLEGTTGLGKTAILSALAEKLSIPIKHVKCPNYTMNGYVGLTISSIFEDLLKMYTKEEVENSLIVLDEFDKIVDSDVKKDGFTIQGELLGMIEGSTIVTPKEREIDTTNMIFVCTGSFSKIRKDYNSEIDIEAEDLIEYGFNEDLVGRLDTENIIHMKKYTKDDYINILYNSELSPLTNLIIELKIYGVKGITYTQSFIEEVASEAVIVDKGVRGLQSIFSKIRTKYLNDILLYGKEYEYIQLVSYKMGGYNL